MSQLKIFCEKYLYDPNFILRGVKDGFWNAWQEVYFNKGINNGIADWQPHVGYRTNLDIATSFFGLPFFNQTKNTHWGNFCHNFLGWDDHKFLLPINIVRACFFSLINLVLIIPRFALNLLKFFTEYLPVFLKILLHGAINQIINRIKSSSSDHWATKTLFGIPLLVLFPLYIVFKLVYLIGSHTTSPHKCLYAAWKAGEDLAGNGILGTIVSGVFSLMSLALTTLIYLILFPILIKLLITYAPSAIGAGIQTVLNFMAPLSKFGSLLANVTTPIFHLMGGFFYYIATPVITGLAGVVGLTAGPFVVLLDKVDEGLMRFSKWWRESPAWFDKPAASVKPKYQHLPKPKQYEPSARPEPVVDAQRKAHQRPAGQPRKEAKKEIVKKKSWEINANDLTGFIEIGEGGFGKVYKAQYRGRIVAVKEAQAGDILGKKEFEREFGLMTQFDSPFVVHVFGACRMPNYIVMEFMSGGSLDKFLRKTPSPTWCVRYKIGIDITMGMEYLHQQKNIIHADLKSLNILIDDKARAKITDFGLAKLKANDQTCAKTLIAPTGGGGGTPLWMAPELFEEGAKTTKASDVYSYGMILWELGAMRFPQYKDKEPIAPDTPIKMTQIITQCWNKNPEKRPHLDKRLVNVLEQEYLSL